jgi:hypothetical protein
MPTKRPRLQITLPDETAYFVDRIHTLVGGSKAAIVTELLEQVTPVFRTHYEALEMLHSAPEQAKRIINNFANESIAKLAQHQLELDKVLDGRTIKGMRRKTGGLRGRKQT